MSSNSSKKGSSKADGRSSGRRSSHGSHSSTNRESTLSSPGINAEAQEGADLSQWGALLIDNFGRVYRERQLSDGTWQYDFQVDGASNVPRTNPDSGTVNPGQDLDSQTVDLSDNDSSSYKLNTPTFLGSYQGSTSTRLSTLTNTSLATIPEPFNMLNVADSLRYDSLQNKSMVDDFGIPVGNTVIPEQAQPIGGGNFTQERLQQVDTKGVNDDWRPNFSPALGFKISGNAGGAGEQAAQEAAALDPKFKVHPARDFKFGDVFKIYWSEPMGQGNSRPDGNGTERIPIKLSYGELCYASIRRFIIARPTAGHCLCLPILTYGGQATTKKGVKPQDHAIIYTVEEKRGKSKSAKLDAKEELRRSRPTKLDAEENLPNSPIAIVPKTNRDKLDTLSRLNYAKIYTVEYNVKVCFVGSIHKESEKYFLRDYNLNNTPLPENPNTEYSDEEPQQARRRFSDATSFDKDQNGGKKRRN